MIINTKELDYSRFYKILNISNDGESILVNAFLGRFHELFDSFKDAVLDDVHESRKASNISNKAAGLKDFILAAGGIRAADMLAEYEKHSSIADFVSCSRMEKKLFIEIEAFKETVVSMFA